MFNRWKPFPAHKPKENGWYLTTIEVKNQKRYVTELYWHNYKQRFINTANRVVAFKKLPKAYMKGSIKDNMYGVGLGGSI